MRGCSQWGFGKPESPGRGVLEALEIASDCQVSRDRRISRTQNRDENVWDRTAAVQGEPCSAEDDGLLSNRARTFNGSPGTWTILEVSWEALKQRSLLEFGPGCGYAAMLRPAG